MPATTRQQLLRDGVPHAAIDRARRRRELRPWVRGYYPLDDAWSSLAAAHLLRGGPGSALSHRTAARLHRFDVRDEHFDGVDLIVPPFSSFRTAPAMRSRTLLPADVVTIRDLPVTSPVRTLLDLGAKVTLDELELAVESVLRSDDPMDPANWHEDVFDELTARAATFTGPGGAAIRTVLGRRPAGVRPTGSAAETVGLQGLRAHGFGDVLRQPTVIVHDDVHGRHGTYYPDEFDVTGCVGPEIDGRQHATLEQRRHDAQRDLVMADFVRVVRTPATDVLADPDAYGRKIARVIRDRRESFRLPDNVTMTVEDNVITFRRTRR